MKCSWLATCCLQMRYVLLCLVDPLLVVWQEIFFGPHFTTTSHGYLDRTKPFSEEHMVIICCHGNFSEDHQFSHALKNSIMFKLLFWYFLLEGTKSTKRFESSCISANCVWRYNYIHRWCISKFSEILICSEILEFSKITIYKIKDIVLRIIWLFI